MPFHRLVLSLLFLFFLSAPLVAAPTPPPPVLYHWTTYDSLARMAKSLRASPAFPLKTISAEFLVAQSVPSLLGKPGLFAWPHPVAGIGANDREIYGGEVLVKLFIATDRARVLDLTTDAEKPRKPPAVNLAKVDLIFHKRIGWGAVAFQEWIVVNPAVVADFTAAHDVLTPEVQAELERLQDDDFQYPDDSLHVPGTWLFTIPAQRRLFVLPLLETYVGESDSRLPREFRRPAPAR